MKQITIQASCTYTVEITTDVPDEVYAQLLNISERHFGVISDCEMHNPKALDWLGRNINEADAFSWKYGIEDIVENNHDQLRKT